MTVIIKIENSETRTHRGISQRTNKEFEIVKQRALLFRAGETYPDKIDVVVPDGMRPYGPGDYVLHPSSFQVDRFGSMTVRPVLMPAPAAKGV